MEADLPDMAARKRRALERIGTLGPAHRVEAVDALSDASFDRLLGGLDPARGLAIITEGLSGYLDPQQLHGLWRRFARGLAGFSAGRYLADLHVGEQASPVVAGFALVLSAFVRGRVHLHYGTSERGPPGVARLRVRHRRAAASVDAGAGDQRPGGGAGVYN